MMAFCWRADDGPLIVALRSSLPSSTKKTKREKKVKVGPPLTKLSVSAHAYNKKPADYFNSST